MTPSLILHRVAAEFSLTVEDLIGRRRDGNVLLPRQIAQYLCRQDGMSYPQIGRLMHRDHSTVMYSCRVVEERMRADARVRAMVEGMGTHNDEDAEGGRN